MDRTTERRLLQLSVAVASLVPILAGSAGIIYGTGMMGAGGQPALDSHFRYLSGLLLGIGLAFAASVPAVAMHRRRFRLLCATVVLGGVGRFISLLSSGNAGWPDLAALTMELVVTPALTVWQQRMSAPT
jgi:hypothetical protein